MTLRPFHLALPVASLDKARAFYLDVLGCEEGRSADTWVDFNFFGHQLVFHLDPNKTAAELANSVDDKQVPVPHMGVVLKKRNWELLSKKLSAYALPFIIEPYVRFLGQVGEQGTFFLYDYNKIALEFKYFESDDMLFEK